MKALPLMLALAVTTPVAAEETPEPTPPTQAETPTADEAQPTAEDGDGEASESASDAAETVSTPPAYDAETSCAADLPKSSFELGGTLGNPMGLDLKLFLTRSIALKAVLGTTFSKDVMGSLDLLFLHYPVVQKDSFSLRLFVGLGGIIGSQGYYEELTTAVGLPIGVDLPFEKSPWTISLLLRPGVTLVPDYDFSFSWHLGIRYNFGRADHLAARERCFIDGANGYFADYSEAQHELGETKKDLNETATKLGETEAILENTQESLEKIAADLSNNKAKLQDTQERLGLVKDVLSSTKKELATKEAEIEEKEEDLAKIKEEQEEQKKALEKAEKELEKNEQQRTELENKVAAMKNDIQNTADPEEVAALKKQLEELQSQTEELQGDISDQRRDKCVASGGTFKGDTCNCPDGRVARNDVCVCPQAREVWLASKKECICAKGYYRSKDTQKCTPCRYLKSNGYCRWTACTDQERRNKVDTRDGVDVYTCVNRCSNDNEMWSSRSNSCICQEGYKRVGSACQSRN